MSTTANPPLPDLLTIGEVALLLRVSDETVRRRVASGAIPCLRLGPTAHSAIRIPRAELVAQLREWAA